MDSSVILVLGFLAFFFFGVLDLGCSGVGSVPDSVPDSVVVVGLGSGLPSSGASVS